MRPNRVLSSIVSSVGGSSALSRQNFVHVVAWIGFSLAAPPMSDGGGVCSEISSYYAWTNKRASKLGMEMGHGSEAAGRRAVSDGRRFDMFGHSARLLARKDIFEFPGCTLNRLFTLNVIPIKQGLIVGSLLRSYETNGDTRLSVCNLHFVPRKSCHKRQIVLRHDIDGLISTILLGYKSTTDRFPSLEIGRGRPVNDRLLLPRLLT